jgi:hypothetical protein
MYYFHTIFFISCLSVTGYQYSMISQEATPEEIEHSEKLKAYLDQEAPIINLIKTASTPLDCEKLNQFFTTHQQYLSWRMKDFESLAKENTGKTKDILSLLHKKPTLEVMVIKSCICKQVCADNKAIAIDTSDKPCNRRALTLTQSGNNKKITPGAKKKDSTSLPIPNKPCENPVKNFFDKLGKIFKPAN